MKNRFSDLQKGFGMLAMTALPGILTSGRSTLLSSYILIKLVILRGFFFTEMGNDRKNKRSVEAAWKMYDQAESLCE